MSQTHARILYVMALAKKPLAAHEFTAVTFSEDGTFDGLVNGLQYVGASENALTARLRELRQQNRVKASVRDGKRFKEWSLVESL